jgi:hypothetical protein
MEAYKRSMVDKEVVMDQEKYDEYNKSCGLIAMYRKDLKQSVVKLKDGTFEFSNQSKVDFLIDEIDGYIEAADKIMYYWGAPLEKLYKEEFKD